MTDIIKPSLSQNLIINNLLEDDTKNRLMLAKTMSNEKEKFPFSINLKEVFKTLGLKINENFLHSHNYMILTDKEMSVVFDKEKTGGQIGEYYFISENCPQNFIPFVLLNFKFLTIMDEVNSSNSKLIKKIQELTYNYEHSKHWTSNLLDITIAKQMLPEEEFQDYLSWRKEIERTEMFTNSEMKKIIEYFISDEDLPPSKNYNREIWKAITIPENRGWRTKESVGLIRATSIFDDRKSQDSFIKFSVKADYVYNRIRNNENFNPYLMSKLIDILMDKNNYVRLKRYVQGSQEKYDDKKMSIKIPQHLDSTAFLLSEHECGQNAFLLNDENFTNYMTIAITSRSSLQALKDRITAYEIHPLKNAIENNNDFKPFFDPLMINMLKDLNVPNAEDYKIKLLTTKTSLLKNKISLTEKTSTFLKRAEQEITSLKSLIEQIEKLIQRNKKVIYSLGKNTPVVLYKNIIELKKLKMGHIESIKEIETNVETMKALESIYADTHDFLINAEKNDESLAQTTIH